MISIEQALEIEEAAVSQQMPAAPFGRDTVIKAPADAR